MTLTPIDLFASAIHFHPDGTVRAGERRMTTDPGGWQIAAFHVETDADVHADHWEMHPAADETVCCLAGGARLILRAEEPGGEEEPVALPAGTAVIVPRGRWHRIELDEPSDLMSVTLRRGTVLERRG
ncbi:MULTISPECIES: cupin domain-containing protein [Thermomonosporaceae]|uniref:cupin domain-containing protein n=1 Tax=Thermomonosporaceae TaxID=2012 RepID=UPI00255AED89|nr:MULTISPECIES: cupin domain-containing protein [Thermomonosporaceae]MDL4774633.1 cupin domain-containing protein [Actinomadura xylanilytica]